MKKSTEVKKKVTKKTEPKEKKPVARKPRAKKVKTEPELSPLQQEMQGKKFLEDGEIRQAMSLTYQRTNTKLELAALDQQLKATSLELMVLKEIYVPKAQEVIRTSENPVEKEIATLKFSNLQKDISIMEGITIPSIRAEQATKDKSYSHLCQVTIANFFASMKLKYGIKGDLAYNPLTGEIMSDEVDTKTP